MDPTTTIKTYYYCEYLKKSTGEIIGGSYVYKKLLAVIEAKSLIEADEIFKEKTKKNPESHNTCVMTKDWCDAKWGAWLDREAAKL